MRVAAPSGKSPTVVREHQPKMKVETNGVLRDWMVSTNLYYVDLPAEENRRRFPQIVALESVLG